MQGISAIDRTSASTNPVVDALRVWTVFTVWDKPLKHVVDVLICDDRQCGVQASTKLSRITPTQHWIVRVETILLIVHWVALGEGRYDIYDVQQNQQTSCRTSAFTITAYRSLSHHHSSDTQSNLLSLQLHVGLHLLNQLTYTASHVNMTYKSTSHVWQGSCNDCVTLQTECTERQTYK